MGHFRFFLKVNVENGLFFWGGGLLKFQILFFWHVCYFLGLTADSRAAPI